MVKTFRHPCDSCPERVNSINGRYCRRLRRYVEYHQQQPCRQQDSNGDNYQAVLARLKQPT